MQSLWDPTNPVDTPSRSALAGDATWDVAIVGGGFTGLWAARSLADADPSLRIVVLEANRCGFGASGRNGGWCSALFPTSETALAERFGAAQADRQIAAMREAVDEVGRAAAADGIDCHFAKGGTLRLATGAHQLARVRGHLASGEVWLDASEASARLAAVGVLGAAYTPHCAAIHPGLLVRGLADAVEQRGVRIAEHTSVRTLAPGVAICRDGTRVRAGAILRCTEGFTPSLRGHRRTTVPIYSLMIATEPLSDEVWETIGLRERETFTDGRHMIIYGQRTADGRFAFGGRGAPYHFGSRVSPRFDADPKVFADLEQTLRELFPQIAGATITHRWGGPLGVPRDWMASVGFDMASGLGWAGGYVGDGVGTANLAGRTLTDLLLGRDTELVRLPWVQHRSPAWEPEPLRWAGVNAGLGLATVADAEERITGRPALSGAVLGRLTGH